MSAWDFGFQVYLQIIEGFHELSDNLPDGFAHLFVFFG